MSSTQPEVAHLTLASADTEYSVQIPENTRIVVFRARTDVAVRYAFEAGKVAGSTNPFETLKAGAEFFSPESATPITQETEPPLIYFATSVAGTVIELEFWS